MVWFIVAGVVAVIIGIVCAWAMTEDFEDGIDGVFGFIFGTLFAGLIGALVALGINGIFYIWAGQAKPTTVTYSLQNIRDTSDVQGHFFLGSGSFNSYPAYYYYLQGNDGAYYLNHIDASGVPVYETNDGNPRMEVTSYKCTDITWSVFCHDNKEKQYAFYVPPGSVVHNYTLGGTVDNNSG